MRLESNKLKQRFIKYIVFAEEGIWQCWKGGTCCFKSSAGLSPVHLGMF